MRRLFASILSIAVGLAGGNVVAQDYKPDFDPGALKGPRVGAPNQILVSQQRISPDFPPRSRPPTCNC
jgi:hypothetical protein